MAPVRKIFRERVIREGCYVAELNLNKPRGAFRPLFLLLYFLDHRFKSSGVVHRQIREHFAVQVDTGLLEFAHQLGVRHAVETCTGIDTSNPQGAEISFLGFAIAVSVNEAFFNRVFGYRPNIFFTTKETFGQFQNALSSCAGCNTVY